MAGRKRRGRRAIFPVVVCALVAASVARAAPVSETPEFTLTPDAGVVGNFFGFGAQLNQHVYAQISGPPPSLPALESEVAALQPQFVRVFFNTSEWTNADRMDSFIRTVQLAQRARATINITWQGSTFAFAVANMSRFADVLADLLQNEGIDSLWVTMFNEPNSTRLTLPQYEQVYRLLDGYLRDRGVRDRVHFMGGDLVGTTSPLGQSQTDWFTYMATHMADLLDAWSVHVYWNFWEPEKIDRRLATEVRTIYAAIPAELRRPLYVTEFGVRGLTTIEGEHEIDPGLSPDGTPIEQTNIAAFQEAWFMIRAAGLGFSGMSKWDLYSARYDNGTQSYSAIGPGTSGWPTRPIYRLLQLLTLATEPAGGRIVDLTRGADAAPTQLVTAYISPADNVAVLGLDTRGGVAATTSHDPEAYRVSGLPANTTFRLVVWNGDGLGDNITVGDLDSGPAGTVDFSAPIDGVFALTSAP